MTPERILSLHDARVAGYRSLRERALRDEGLFVTEGALLAERLLESRFPIESLLVSAGSEARWCALAAGRAPLYVAEPALLRQIVGFDFHRGVLGLARRLPFPDAPTLARQIEQQAAQDEPPAGSAEFLRRLQLVACPATETAENLGLIVRSARAFGAQGLLLPTDGADPLSRRCLRQSMGSSLFLPTARSHDLLRDLREMRRSLGLRLVAAVAGASPSTEGASGRHGGAVVPLPNFIWPARAVLAVGHEYGGLDPLWLDSCDDLVTIPVAPGCDSLNVAVATGVLLHHMSCAATPR